MTFRELYVKETEKVTFSEDFEIRTAELMKQKAETKAGKPARKGKVLRTVAVAVAAAAILSVTAFGVSYLLSADEVADYLGENEIAQMFKDSETEPEKVSNGVYDVAFLGKTTGSTFSMTEGFEGEETKTYAVIAISRTDGTLLKLSEGMPVMAVPVIEGCMPFRTMAILNCGASGLERDGVLYYLFDYENLEVFADRRVSLAVFEGSAFPTADILTTDEKGNIIYADGYSGIKGIFDLPMDESKADPEAAEKMLADY